jgi:transketolase
LVLTRQHVPTLDRTRFAGAEGLRRGAYILSDAPNAKPDLILIATGSEVALVLQAAAVLRGEGIAVRCVSMPCWELFEALPPEQREHVLPAAVRARVAVELGVAQGWHRWVGDAGAVLSVERFGASAPAATLLREYGFTVEAVCAKAREVLAGVARG